MYTFLCVRDSPVGWSTKGVVKRNCSSGVCCRSSYLTNFAVLTNIAGAQHVRWVMLMLALLSVPPPIPPNCPTHLYSCPPHLSPSPVPPLAPPLPSPPVPSCHPTCPPVPPVPPPACTLTDRVWFTSTVLHRIWSLHHLPFYLYIQVSDWQVGKDQL